MGVTARPVFIVGSGRSGTQMMDKMLSLTGEVDSNHEYMCNYVQPLAVKYYLNLLSRDEVLEQVKSIFSSAINYSDKLIWIDSSNKTSWIIDILAELFPEARFVHIVRDGRKVVSSFYHKLHDECYEDRSVSILQSWVNSPLDNIEPPPEKKYWWNLPKKDSEFSNEFQNFNQFERICFHWGEVTRTIISMFEKIDNSSHITFRLEDLIVQPAQLRKLCGFIGVTYNDNLFESLQRPHNINKKVDYLLDEKQKEQLQKIAGDMMHLFSYDQAIEYRMQYDSMLEEE
jgi:hypothetical protein